MSKSKEPPLPEEIRVRLDSMDGSATAEAWKSIGNECFSHGAYLSAIRCYTKALEKGEDTAVVRSNRSAAYIKSPMFAGPSLALKDAERAVELDAGWYKAHLRVGDAQFARKKYDEAKAAYQRALELDSSCSAAAESLRLVERELFLRGLEAQEKEARDDSDQQQQYSVPKAMGSDWSANSTLSGNTMTMSPKSSVGRPPATEEEIEQHIQLWSKDTIPRENRTAMKAFTASLNEADRRAGVEYKSTLLSQFRERLGTQVPLRQGVEERHEQNMRMGEGIDYRNADRYRATLAKGTDGVGLGISTDAYKSYKYESKMW
ncbi:stress-induced-phosphoprotein 1 [Trypanosoma grayi]|uniref:stress-induced-phosphoprotein 1 n=1 Tax=Trypanosoma grayi TaxID=71804 RepID=UPI0004F45783|nr:stress-induced-phosphoprotein 1 [Trypanosoma grayi]KEG06472.1 stress-induced-phosphoprotein 1 [Trypanosoma grayi]